MTRIERLEQQNLRLREALRLLAAEVDARIPGAVAVAEALARARAALAEPEPEPTWERNAVAVQVHPDDVEMYRGMAEIHEAVDANLTAFFAEEYTNP